MKKIILCAGICLAVLAGCSWNKNNSQPAPSASPSPSPSALPTIDPAITEASDIVGETTAFGTPIVSVQMKDGKISWVSIDEIRRRKRWAISISWVNRRSPAGASRSKRWKTTSSRMVWTLWTSMRKAKRRTKICGRSARSRFRTICRR